MTAGAKEHGPAGLRMFTVMGLGLVLLAGTLFLTALSYRFEYGSDHLSRPTPYVVALLVMMGFVYLAAARLTWRTPGGGAMTIGVIALGLSMRVAIIMSDPILEDDYYRYLWDGAVVATGHNPYATPPANAADSDEFAALAIDAGGIYTRVNHPNLTTIYPPIAQAAFALAHALRPWSLGAWRAVTATCDVLTLVLLLWLLRRMRMPAALAIVYWWNPLLLKECYNSAHVDVLLMPLLAAALLLASFRRHGIAALCCTLAAGVKIWPVLLLPLVLRPLLPRPQLLVATVIAIACLLAAFFLPMVLSGPVSESGLARYSRSWEMNDALYMGLAGLFDRGLALGGWGLPDPHLHFIVRAILVSFLTAWVVFWSWHPIESDQERAGRALAIVAALFLIIPAQFPWYFLWVLPFLTLRPWWSLLLLNALLPLYYLRFYLTAAGHALWFDHGVVWLEYAPVWIALLIEIAWWRRHRIDAYA